MIHKYKEGVAKEGLAVCLGDGFNTSFCLHLLLPLWVLPRKVMFDPFTKDIIESSRIFYFSLYFRIRRYRWKENRIVFEWDFFKGITKYFNTVVAWKKLHIKGIV